MNKPKRVDFHMHSKISDGVYKPGKLVAIAAEAGLAAISLTDHDSMDGLSEATSAAAKYDLEIIPGVEISTLQYGEEIHLLGYYPEKSQALHDLLVMLRKDRFSRMKIMVEKLIKRGFKLKIEDIYAEAEEAAPGRLHLARVLLKKKYVHTTNEAFSLYLNKGRAAYAQRNLMEIEAVMAILREARAVPVIAHPGKSKIKSMQSLFKLGIKGIEAFHPDHSATQLKYYQKLALDNNLLITGGSDFHGPLNNMARPLREMALPYRHLEEMKEIKILTC
jgi:3',5'-nucleoside bisphosphate phosphatase